LKKVIPMSPLEETYKRLAAGDSAEIGRLVARQSPRIAALAAAARKQRASSPPSLATSAPRAPASIAAAPRPSRAAEIAAVHLAGVNESRKRAGLAPASAAELEREFADIDQLPPPRTKLTRREAGNIAARQMGAPADQAGIDAMWSGISAQRNATLALAGTTQSQRRASRAQGQAEADAMWTSLATGLNKAAGLATPVQDRAR
jgi:hypothetical protein